MCQAGGSTRITQNVDVVVATSAFGLGIDIEEIRSVIHLCVPESADRLYQEVGRAGRNGRASASLVLWTPADENVAEQIAQARLIGPELAWRRWRSMHAQSRDGERLTVALTAAHDRVLYPWSEANRYWNTQTLAAMERAGMIRRHWPEPTQAPQDADEDELAAYFDTQRTSASIEVLDSDIGDEQTFRDRFAIARQSSRAAASAALDAATHLLRGLNECTNRYLARRYALTDESGNLLPVAPACGGCPYCREAGVQPFPPPRFDTMASGELARPADDHLSTLCCDGRLCVRTDGLDRAAERALLTRLVRHGVAAIVAPRNDIDFTPPGRSGAYWVEEVREWSTRVGAPWKVPTVLWVDDTVDDRVLARALTQLARQPAGILLAPSHRPDPNNDKQLLHEAWTPSYSIDDLLRRL